MITKTNAIIYSDGAVTIYIKIVSDWYKVKSLKLVTKEKIIKDLEGVIK
jgi:hypothetical protein